MGAQLCFDQPQRRELEHRIKCAWAKFQSHRQELTGKCYRLNDRLKLFDSVVSPIFLYGSSCWTLRKDQETLINRTQRKMLRIILGAGRRRAPPNTGPQTEPSECSSGSDIDSDDGKAHPDETIVSETELEEDLEHWSEWIKRTTHFVEAQLQKLEIQSWVVRVRRQKWRLVSRIAMQDDDRWTKKAMKWDPSLMFDGLVPIALRRQARPKMRWSDSLTEFLSKELQLVEPNLLELARDREFWGKHEDEFCKCP